MAIVSTITIGAVTYNVYAFTADPVADANGYLAANIDAAAWTAATTLQKQQAIITAFRMIERERWSGVKLVSSQPTEWPRTGATKYGEVVPDGVPDDIANGEFELALALLKNAAILGATSTASSVKGVGAGSARVDFFYPLPGSTTKWPLPANDLLAPYLDGSFGISAILPYVGTGESDFTSLDADRSEGFA